jgi:uncharacterized protein (DUF433 family)
MTTEQLSEAERAARVPGIEFVDGTDGTRRAKPIGTGLEVWQIVRYWLGVQRDAVYVLESYPWLQQSQLDAALQYYKSFPTEIDWHLRESARFDAWMMENGPILFTPDGPVRYQSK